jgi:hypothetical protein
VRHYKSCLRLTSLFVTKIWTSKINNIPTHLLFLTIKPTRCTNFLKFILEIKLYMFRRVSLSVVRSYSLYTRQWCMSYRFVDSFRARQLWVWHIPLLSVQWITPDDGQRNCPKHVEIHFQNKFEKIIASSWFYCKEIRHDAQSHGRKDTYFY